MVDRIVLGRMIASRLNDEKNRLKDEYIRQPSIPCFVLDNLLPEEVALQINAAFPDKGRMTFKNSIRERKFISAQMNQHDAILEEIVFAFQQPDVLAVVQDITNIQGLEPDKNLYAGGISAMPKGNYLKPHLDNSHDAKQEKYRALNLLYYVTPNWRPGYGGHLELWYDGPKGRPHTIHSNFNRLAVMTTNQASCHSVSEIVHDDVRRCISNYYFSQHSPEAKDYFHATSFRGRPEEPLRDVVMRLDNSLRTTILKTTGTKLYKNPHIYTRDENTPENPG